MSYLGIKWLEKLTSKILLLLCAYITDVGRDTTQREYFFPKSYISLFLFFHSSLNRKPSFFVFFKLIIWWELGLLTKRIISRFDFSNSDDDTDDRKGWRLFWGKTFNLKFLKKYHVIITTHFSLSKGKNKLRNTDLSWIQEISLQTKNKGS